jgi:hypothetical protein
MLLARLTSWMRVVETLSNLSIRSPTSCSNLSRLRTRHSSATSSTTSLMYSSRNFLAVLTCTWSRRRRKCQVFASSNRRRMSFGWSPFALRTTGRYVNLHLSQLYNVCGSGLILSILTHMVRCISISSQSSIHVLTRVSTKLLKKSAPLYGIAPSASVLR